VIGNPEPVRSVERESRWCTERPGDGLWITVVAILDPEVESDA
jgi:hypothetical protein